MDKEAEGFVAGAIIIVGGVILAGVLPWPINALGLIVVVCGFIILFFADKNLYL